MKFGEDCIAEQNNCHIDDPSVYEVQERLTKFGLTGESQGLDFSDEN
jgi:hypothetical protein